MKDQKTMHIDDPRRAEVVAALRPGDFIEVQGNGGPMTICAPSLEEHIEAEIEVAVERKRGQPIDNSWFD